MLQLQKNQEQNKNYFKRRILQSSHKAKYKLVLQIGHSGLVCGFGSGVLLWIDLNHCDLNIPELSSLIAFSSNIKMSV